jgi:hypothetical protein
MSTDKKLYYQEYHRKNYVKKESACALCGVVSFLGRKKYCASCAQKIPNRCIECGQDFVAKAKYKSCPKCTYHLYKKRSPESFAAMREKRNKNYNKKLRVKKGLPIDHVFPKGPRGLGYLNKKGYLLVCYKHPSTGRAERKYQHVLVMQNYLGRELFVHETVHHKNGVRNDNRLENLELWSKAQPAGQRVTDKLEFYKEFLEQYGHDVIKRNSEF